jgi:hypothetical protein
MLGLGLTTYKGESHQEQSDEAAKDFHRDPVGDPFEAQLGAAAPDSQSVHLKAVDEVRQDWPGDADQSVIGHADVLIGQLEDCYKAALGGRHQGLGFSAGQLQFVAVTAGRIASATLAFGRWLGFGENLAPVPWDALTFTPGMDRVTLNKEKLRKAPQFAKDKWPATVERQ